MKVEFLIVTQQDEGFCNSESTFNNLLQANGQIVIEKNKLSYTHKTKKLEVEYSLETDEIKDKKQRYFHVKLIAEDEYQIELFTSLVRTVKKILQKIETNIPINTLWDDISKYYIIQAYPLINEVENVMRKLILKFMIVNVGMDWADERITSDLKNKISKKAEQNNVIKFKEDILHNADFIQLSNILFEKKRDKDINQLDSLLQKKKEIDTITIKELKKDYFPISNWDRYFSKLINYEGKLLEEKWKQLYDLRNKIAHNKSFSKSELDEVKTLHNEIIEKLNEAIKELDKVKLNEDQKIKLSNYYHTSLYTSKNDLFLSKATIYFTSDCSLLQVDTAISTIYDLFPDGIFQSDVIVVGSYRLELLFSKKVSKTHFNDLMNRMKESDFKIEEWSLE